MRFMKRTNSYKASNFQFFVDTKKSMSYDWWLFSTIYKGKLIFNNVFYSQSTCGHQSKALRLLDYKCDLTLRFTKENLTNVESTLEHEVLATKKEIQDLINKIRTPRTRKTTNAQRKVQITEYIAHITSIRNLLME